MSRVAGTSTAAGVAGPRAGRRSTGHLLSERLSPAMMAGGGLIVAAVAAVVAARPTAAH